MNKSRGFLGASVGTVAALMMASAAHAQMATSGIHGDAAPNAEVVARNVDSGFTTTDTADAEGEFRLQGLQPGTYDVTVTAGGETVTQRVRVLVGQTSFLALGPAEEGEIVVTARRLDDPTTSEVGTNVTREQIEGLPQITRNFLNFAALAPGVRTSAESTGEVTFDSGGQPARSVNVFIDGQSQKAQIIDGGVSGQDDSRGNPFPQLAIQEFRVLTQNFGAQYDTASSAIITSVTRSGTNDFEAEGFATWQPEDWVTYNRIAPPQGRPVTERRQYGVAVGGPIIRDRLHFFGTYEGRQDDKFANVTVGNSAYQAQFEEFLGTVATPFEQDILFGKLSFQPSQNHRFDLSATYREERDIRNVGGQETAERANVLDITETKVNFRYDWQGNGWSNLAQIDYLESNYNPTAINFTDPGREYIVFRDNIEGTPEFDFNFDARTGGPVILLGGRGENQDITQETWTLRDDFSLPEIDFAGTHNVQIGGRIAFNNYSVAKEFNRNPLFTYDIDGRPEINGSAEIPVRVFIGNPTPVADVDNAVYGFYIQDDWRVTDRLEVNIGLRWDYEDNAFNNDYTTPDDIRALLAAYEASPFDLLFDPDEYISDGDRDAFTNAWQPRLGFSYDLSGDEGTVLFGGAGRYYDRVPYNFAFDELAKPRIFNHIFFFSADGLRPGTIAWDPIFATPEGLQTLIDGSTGVGQVFLVKDGAEPPVTDQFSLGIRQRFGDWRTSATLAYSETRNGFGWYRGNFGGPTPASLGFPQFDNNVFYSNHDQVREYEALFLTADKPYSEESGWGASITYTLSHATQNGSRDNNTAPFDFDYATIEDTPTYDSPNDERHRLVASGILDLPWLWNTRVSGVWTYGSGTPFHIFGPSPPGWNEGRNGPYRQLDMRLSKVFEIEGDHELEFFLDVLNASDEFNNPSVEQCTCGILGVGGVFPNQIQQGRSFQVGARARW